MEIDGQVARREAGLGSLLDQFVCVRLIEANTLDLTLLQFDYDLTFAAVFLNGDRTVYGRYGSRLSREGDHDVSIEGFRQAAEGALALHRGYPGNRAALAGKQPRATVFKTPLEFPKLKGKFSEDLDWGGKVAGSCVHCHMVRASEREIVRSKGQPMPDKLIFVSPPPQALGLVLDPRQRARVSAVLAGSPAAAAGVRPGDDLLAAAGQPVISIADVQWALDGVPDAGGAMALGLDRGGKSQELSLAMPDGWRRKSDISWRPTTWGFRGMIGGLLTEDLPDDERARRGIAKDSLALLAKHVGEFGPHAAAKRAGFQKNDVLIEIDGISARRTETEMLAHLLQQRRPGDKVPVTVLRHGKRMNFLLPMQ